MKAIKCANRLLKIGVVKKVFFATDAEDILEIAKKEISLSALVYSGKKMTPRFAFQDPDLEVKYLRGEMDDALKDWFVLGKADYCAAPTLDRSTFSQTALNNGNCKFIPYDLSEKCETSINSTVYEKKIRCIALEKMHDAEPLSKERREKIWKDYVRKGPMQRAYPCLQGTDPADIIRFWTSKGCTQKEDDKWPRE